MRMDGNGDKLRQTLAQLSGVGRILADGSGNIADIITNLQTFVTALRDSNDQIVQFQGRFATLTSVVDDSRSDLDAALTNLSDVVGETSVSSQARGTRPQSRFSGWPTSPRTWPTTGWISKNFCTSHRHAIANAYNMFDPRTGAASRVFALSNFGNPVRFICGRSAPSGTSPPPETAKLCAQYLGPALRLLNFNYLPLPFNPFLPRPPARNIYLQRAERSRQARRAAAPGPTYRRLSRRIPEQATCRRPRVTVRLLGAPPPAV